LNFIEGSRARKDNRKDALLTNATRNQLRVLRTKVEDDYGGGFHALLSQSLRAYSRMGDCDFPTTDFSQSYLRACTGSSRAARAAGYSPATRLTNSENPIAPKISHSGTSHTSSGVNCCWRCM